MIVLYEMEKLSLFWRQYPVTYFIFHMHLKDFGDYKRMKSFVTREFYSNYVGSTDYDILINDKILFHDLCAAYNLPVPKLYFVFRENKFFLKNRIVDKEEINNLISNIKDELIFVKRYRGGGGSGVYVFKKGKDGYYDNSNNKLTADYVAEKYRNINLLFEKQLQQDSLLASVNPDSINTIRVQLIENRKREVEIIAAAVRFGRKGSFVDNASQGGIVVSLDIKTCQLGEFGSRLYDLNKYYKHPDTKVPFKNIRIKEWNDVKDLVYKTAEYLPYYKGVGFDIALTQNGPVIIEINSGAGMYLPQLGKEKGIADYFL